MGALKIDCLLSESQMNSILKRVENHLSESDGDSISDFDDVIGKVRVCVELEHSYILGLLIKSSEILSEDWDVLHEDTAVFTSRLRKVIADHNKDEKEALTRAEQIRQDQLSYNHC